MELKIYLRVLAARWWIVLPVALIAFLATAVLTFEQTPLYESTATYIVKVRTLAPDDRNVLSALDTLSGESVIGTFAELAGSHRIRSEVGTDLGLTPDQLADVTVSSQPLAGTSVMVIAVLAPDPVLAHKVASAVGERTTLHVQQLYGVFALQPLDEATLPRTPAKPTVALNLLLGAMIGLVLGAGLAFTSAYLQSPAEETSRANQAVATSALEPIAPPRRASATTR